MRARVAWLWCTFGAAREACPAFSKTKPLRGHSRREMHHKLLHVGTDLFLGTNSKGTSGNPVHQTNVWQLSIDFP